jgi:REP element-mobilizing transposase RayT
MPKRSPKSISSFVAGFKSAATSRINQYRMTPKMPVWQTRFYDHIIRDEGEYQRIDHYIRNNPLNWKKDKFSFNK